MSGFSLTIQRQQEFKSKKANVPTLANNLNKNVVWKKGRNKAPTKLEQCMTKKRDTYSGHKLSFSLFFIKLCRFLVSFLFESFFLCTIFKLLPHFLQHSRSHQCKKERKNSCL